MKKTILILMVLLIIGITMICVKYSSYKIEYNAILKENAEFEEYNRTVYGIELATLINKAIDKNAKNRTKDRDIVIEIYMQDNEQTYKMETFYNSGMEQFIQYYGNEEFKCSKIEYEEITNKIKYLLFEQI